MAATARGVEVLRLAGRGPVCGREGGTDRSAERRVDGRVDGRLGDTQPSQSGRGAGRFGVEEG